MKNNNSPHVKILYSNNRDDLQSQINQCLIENYIFNDPLHVLRDSSGNFHYHQVMILYKDDNDDLGDLGNPFNEELVLEEKPKDIELPEGIDWASSQTKDMPSLIKEAQEKQLKSMMVMQAIMTNKISDFIGNEDQIIDKAIKFVDLIQQKLK